VLAFLCAVIILCAEPGGAAQNRTKLVIGYSAMQASVAPLWVAQEQGFFSKYGIDPELIFVRTTSVQIAGLLSGHMDLSYGGGSGILPVAGSGVDLRFVASFASRLSHLLLTKPEIQKPKDLSGKRIGVVSIGGTQWITTKLGLEYLGIDEQRDNIRLLAIGDQSVLRGALEGGNIEAAFFQRRDSGRITVEGFSDSHRSVRSERQDSQFRSHCQKGLPAKKSRADDKRASSPNRRTGLREVSHA